MGSSGVRLGAGPACMPVVAACHVPVCDDRLLIGNVLGFAVVTTVVQSNTRTVTVDRDYETGVGMRIKVQHCHAFQIALLCIYSV